MAKGSGSTRTLSPNNKGEHLSPQEEKRLIGGFKYYMDLYTNDKKYSDNDVKSFERMIENSRYTGELYRGTVFDSEEALNKFISRLEKKKVLTDLNDFTQGMSEEEESMRRSSGENLERANKRKVVSFATNFRSEYAVNDYLYEEDLPQYGVMFHVKERTVIGKYLQSEAEVAVSLKNKFKVRSIRKIKDDYFPAGYYTRIELE